MHVIRNLDDAVWASVLFGIATLVVVLAMKRFVPAIPGALVAVVGSMLVVLVFDVDVAVVGEFSSGLPNPGLPDIGWSDVAAPRRTSVSPSPSSCIPTVSSRPGHWRTDD